MIYALFNWDNITTDVSDPTELTDDEFLALAEADGGNHIYQTIEDFESAFNGEQFGTATHQLRIIIGSLEEKEE